MTLDEIKSARRSIAETVEMLCAEYDPAIAKGLASDCKRFKLLFGGRFGNVAEQFGRLQRAAEDYARARADFTRARDDLRRALMRIGMAIDASSPPSTST